MALETNALTTVSTVRAELGLTYCEGASSDEVLERYINAASAQFESWTGRKWYYKAGHTERVKGYATELLRVRQHVPIVTLTSIEFDHGLTTSTIDTNSYELADETQGFPAYIRRRAGVWRDTRDVAFGVTARRIAGSARGLYIVTYDGGYVTPQQADDGVGARTLPYDVEDAVLDYVAMRMAQQGTDTTIRRLEMDDGVIEWNRQRIPQTFYNAVVAHQIAEVA